MKKLLICSLIMCSLICVGVGTHAMPQPQRSVKGGPSGLDKPIKPMQHAPSGCNAKGAFKSVVVSAATGAATGARTGAMVGGAGAGPGALSGLVTGAIIGGFGYYVGCDL